MKRIAVIAALVLAGLTVAWYVMRPVPVAITLVTAERGPVAATVANTRAGTVDACRRAGLSPASGGQIANLPVVDGEHVAEGQLLLELWNEDVKAELTLAERDARAARSRAREVCVTAAVARRDAERLMKLRDERLASEEAADQAEGRAESTAAACTAAEDATRVADARVDVTRAHLERTQLHAPFAGVIAEINGELGEFVTPSPVGIPTPPTVDLIDASCLYISAPIDEVDAPRIREGLPARISLDAFPDRVFPGHVRRVAPYVLDQEKQARTVEIEAEFENPEGTGLLAGYSADVEVVLEERDDTLRLPTSVILPDKTVYVLDEASGRIALRRIETGIANWEFTEILNGVAAGDRVVSSIDREGVVDGALVVQE
ncbi:MAG TPA: efflux RND transporter periplasmic adaptor subunit [Gammaproteobacteria bacterium]